MYFRKILIAMVNSKTVLIIILLIGSLILSVLYIRLKNEIKKKIKLVIPLFIAKDVEPAFISKNLKKISEKFTDSFKIDNENRRTRKYIRWCGGRQRLNTFAPYFNLIN